MRKLSLIFVAIFIMPKALFAQAPAYEESIYVVTYRNILPIPYDQLAAVCGPYEEFLYLETAVRGFSADLYSIQTKKNTGKLLVDGIKKVGQVVTCSDAGFQSLERNNHPEYDIGAISELTIDGVRYFAGGASRFRTPPPPLPGAFPEFGVVLSGTDYTLFNPLTLERAGAMTANGLENLFDVEGYESNAIAVIRIYVPTAE